MSESEEDDVALQFLNQIKELETQLKGWKHRCHEISCDLVDMRTDRDHYKSIVEQIANDGCGLSYQVADRIVDCRTHNPDDPSEWCWCCIARKALEGKP